MLIVTGRRIFDGLRFDAKIEAIAIDQDRIVAVGKKPEILALATSSKEIFDFPDHIIMPGITDAHIHLLHYGRSQEVLNCETGTKLECLSLVRNQAKFISPGKWIIGHGWNQNIWHDGKPTRKELDAVSPKNPVCLTDKSLHSIWVNTLALEYAGINAQTADPPGGTIGRDNTGELDGVLYENATQLVNSVLPEPTDSEIMQLLIKAQAALIRQGITAVHDFDNWQVFKVLKDLDTNRNLLLKIVKNITCENLDEAIHQKSYSGMQIGRLTLGWLKLFSDGALGPQTAALFAPYSGTTHAGKLLLEEEQIVSIGKKAAQANIALAIHAIGDLATHVSLNALARIKDCTDALKLKPRIEHAQLVSPGDFKRFSELGIIASMQPIHAISDQVTAEKYWGERCVTSYAWQSMLNECITLIFGSDAPVEDPNPVKGIRAAIWRKTMQFPNGWHPEQQLTLEQALRAFTSTPAKIAGCSQDFGTIKPGRKADLVVYPNSVFDSESSNVIPTGVMIDGQWVSQNS